MNFVFCEREPYAGTAPEQKTKSAKSGLNTQFKPLFQINSDTKYSRQEQAPALRNIYYILYNWRGLAALSTV